MINSRDLFNVYFVRPVGMDGPIKIGLSGDPERRRWTCEAWSPFPLEIIGAVPGRNSDEVFLHDVLADHHSHGEWFRAAPLVLEVVEMVLSSGGFDGVRGKFVPVSNVKSKKIRDGRARRGERSAA